MPNKTQYKLIKLIMRNTATLIMIKIESIDFPVKKRFIPSRGDAGL
jgi:hypothetical protein